MSQPYFSTIRSACQNKTGLLVHGVTKDSTSYLLSRLLHFEMPPLIVVTNTEKRAIELHDSIEALTHKKIWLYPAEQYLPYQEISFDPIATMQRMQVLTDCLSEKPLNMLITSVKGLRALTISKDEISKRGELIVQGEELDRDLLLRKLQACGYEQVDIVEEIGSYAVRGAIIDVFPPDFQDPIRIDLFGDLVEGLFFYDVVSQRKKHDLDEFVLFPIREVVLDQDTIPLALDNLNALADSINIPTTKLRAMQQDIQDGIHFFGIEALRPLLYKQQQCLWDYVQPYHPYIIWEEYEDIIATNRDISVALQREYEQALEKNKIQIEGTKHFQSEQYLELLIEHAIQNGLFLNSLKTNMVAERIHVSSDNLLPLKQEISARRLNIQQGEILEPFIDQLKRFQKNLVKVVLLTQNEQRAKRLLALLENHGLHVQLSKTSPIKVLESMGRAGEIVAAICEKPITLKSDHVAFLSDDLLFGEIRPAAKNKPTSKGIGLKELQQLSLDDFVVHVEHGIGQYAGIKRLSIDGMLTDFIHLNYADGDKLYIPMVQLHLLHAYTGPKNLAKVDKLGGNRWIKAKQKVREATLELAAQLLQHYAQRQLKKGIAYKEQSDLYAQFENSFPYDETDDQRKAIDDVITDLAVSKPMDRLICGDVGFGKTEVAMRAAYKVVLAGYQVAVLVPTTILAMQHGRTFENRFKQHPVKIETLSRFKSKQEQSDILNQLSQGKVDIVIGTHRLLSQDVNFSKLGLLIIDEEQRFGVKHKEKLRQLKVNMDVLTLTATPIPRTMYMSLVGLRDISLIQTPPASRLAVKTTVARFDNDLLKQAIAAEIKRGGQVYVLHNRVQTIDAMAQQVTELVPEARVAIAHGQLSESNLEQVMIRFIQQEYNVLVCSTIIENGLDIPSVNTLIVNRADMLGLSQLYQIRGRIGRGRQRAYAYFFIPSEGDITRDARQRLAALQRFSGLGVGIRIAQEDLEIRGSGDLLGPDQSGYMAAVGFELYTELLSQAVEELKGNQHGARLDKVDVKLPVSALIPEDYITETGLRIAYYQRFGQCQNSQQLYQLAQEMSERFGNLPGTVETLLGIFRIKQWLQTYAIKSLYAQQRENGAHIIMQFDGNHKAPIEQIIAKCVENPEQYRMFPNDKLVIVLSEIPENDFAWIDITQKSLFALFPDDTNQPLRQDNGN